MKIPNPFKKPIIDDFSALPSPWTQTGSQISHVKVHKPAKLGQTAGATSAIVGFSMPSSASAVSAAAWVGASSAAWTPNSAHYDVDVDEVLIDDAGGMLPCYGCGHSAADEQFPSRPSGERPCHFCVRNTHAVEWKRKNPHAQPTWYDGSKPLRLNEMGLQDNYISTDRLQEDIERTTPVNEMAQNTEERMVSLWRKATRED